MGCGVSREQQTAVRQFSAGSHSSAEAEGPALETITEERRMISASLGEGEDWLARERGKLRKLQALPPIPPARNPRLA
jgi:hypothetical protein